MKKIVVINLLVVSVLLAACSVPSASIANQIASVAGSAVQNQAPQATAAPAVQSGETLSLLAAYEGALQNVYNEVNPSVVNIRVLVSQPVSTGFETPGTPFQFPGLPGLPGNPNSPQSPNTPQYGEGLGSGFVWDKQGHIVTNNHVVENADKIEVTFADGTTLEAKLVGTDPDSDLAVIQVNRPADELVPLQIANSDNVSVGQLAIAIGNPYGLQGTMTAGIISAIGRTLPVDLGQNATGSYSIPDIIQTDAPINPGNSGGVLVNDQGQVVGVTFALESSSGANSGIGFVIPSAIVQRVVPALIKDGSYQHTYLGISGGTLVPSLAEAMNLKSDQRGVLVAEVVPNGPADKAGLLGSTRQVTIDGSDVNVGGDVITAIDGKTINTMDELISYLARNTDIGQKVNLTILRDGKQMDVSVTMAARPATQTAAANIPGNQGQQQQQQQQPASAWLGIRGMTLFPALAQAMNLDQNQEGVLVVDVQAGSPADDAGLKGSLEQTSINGQTVAIGGDVITTANGGPITSMEDLLAQLTQSEPGQEMTLTVLRNGQSLDLTVTLGERPASQ